MNELRVVKTAISFSRIFDILGAVAGVTAIISFLLALKKLTKLLR